MTSLPHDLVCFTPTLFYNGEDRTSLPNWVPKEGICGILTPKQEHGVVFLLQLLLYFFLLGTISSWRASEGGIDNVGEHLRERAMNACSVIGT